MTHNQIRDLAHKITYNLLLSLRTKYPSYTFSRYGCERYTDGKNSYNPDFFANIMMLPANCHKSRCGFCLEVNYDHKVNHIRFLWGIRNDKVDGIINPKLINYFMVRNQGCLNICDNFKKANEDHWLVWRELKLQRGLKNNNQAISGSQIDYLAQNLTTKLQTEIEKDLQGF